MNTTTTTAGTAVCFCVRFASAVHGGPVATLVYATSPAGALAAFNADGPAVRVLTVIASDGTEHDPADLVATLPSRKRA